MPGDQVGDDAKPAGILLEPTHQRESFVVQARQLLGAGAKGGLEYDELGPEVEAFQHPADFAIESDGPPPQAVLVPGGGDRR